MSSKAVTALWYAAFLVSAIFLVKLASKSTTEHVSQLNTAVESMSVDTDDIVGKKRQKNLRKEIRWQDSERYLSIYDRTRTEPGLTLVPTCGSAEVLLLNMKGQVVHKWDVDAARARLQPNGNIVVVHGSTWGETKKRWKQLMSKVIEYDWDGNEVWRYDAGAEVHHDLQRLPNGNTSFLIQVKVPQNLQQKATDPVRRTGVLITDAVVEVNRQGQEVWRWNLYDHFSVNFCGPRNCVVRDEVKKKDKFRRDWTHTNALTVVPENKWFDAGDTRFRPGNILINPRRFWMPIIIDKETGKVVWRYDEHQQEGVGYGGGVGAPHETRMIAKGLPGAGNILLFDNGVGAHNGISYVIELDPVTKKVVWAYDKGEKFFNKTRGSVQRLKNGNTLISWDRTGRVLEVTPQGETVWQFNTPVELTRAHRYDFDYCERCKEFADS
jgi:hypothetical protein